MIESVPLVVIKKDGSRELFDRNKILNGLLRACNKRVVTVQTMEEIVNHIERDIRNSLVQEIETVKIGEMVMVELRQVDQVAYVRFASVYRQFADLEQFMKELKSLMTTGNKNKSKVDVPKDNQSKK